MSNLESIIKTIFSEFFRYKIYSLWLSKRIVDVLRAPAVYGTGRRIVSKAFARNGRGEHSLNGRCQINVERSLVAEPASIATQAVLNYVRLGEGKALPSRGREHSFEDDGSAGASASPS